MSGLVSQEDIMEWSGFNQPGRLESWLIKKNIQYFRGCNGKICTTTEAVNEALKLASASDTVRRPKFAKTG